jgi:hypothetical protein
MAKQKEAKQAPKVHTKKGERKKCKSPRGVKTAKVVDTLLIAVDLPHKRHRNDYNARMAKVSRLAKLL